MRGVRSMGMKMAQGNAAVGNEATAAALWVVLVPRTAAATALGQRYAAHPPLCMALLTGCRGSVARRAQLCTGKGASVMHALLCAAVRPPPPPPTA
jgi:hypothetical protein